MKIVVNRCFGGFGLSDKACEMIMKRKGLGCFKYKQTKYKHREGLDEYTKCETFDPFNTVIHYQTEDLGEKVGNLPNETRWSCWKLDRDDDDLIAVVEELGKKADSIFSKLEVVEIPDDVNWYMDTYDGLETIHEEHRTW